MQRTDGSKFTDRCNVIINGSGPLNCWKCKHAKFLSSTCLADPLGPDIESIDRYKGVLVHTANRNKDVDWHGKRVAVTGSGASVVQITPKLVEGKPSSEY